ncbi:MAG: hypothetical protein LBG65_05465 [Puniceicoccales bacterium]|jgi:hypothetical protein|nr:hypothetical protein [Puniceicoccales bacterium]
MSGEPLHCENISAPGTAKEIKKKNKWRWRKNTRQNQEETEHVAHVKDSAGMDARARKGLMLRGREPCFGKSHSGIKLDEARPLLSLHLTIPMRLMGIDAWLKSGF